MGVQALNTNAAEGAQATHAGRLLLLLLLVLLPVSISLACPEPASVIGPGTAEQDASAHANGPSETPVCHHERHLAKGPVLLGDPREVGALEPADDSAAIALPALVQARRSDPSAVHHGSLDYTALPPVPVYLLTLRLRV